jgi:DNA-binding MarR family transcriptional regulator
MSESTMPDDIGRRTGIDEVVRLASNYLRQTWSLIDTLLPEELRPIRDGLNLGHTRSNQRIGLITNFMMFLSIAGILHRYGSLTMGELSRTTSIPRSTATRMIDWMVDNGYVDRFRDGEDRRIMRIRLTDGGLELLLAAQAQLRELAGKFVERLPAVQRAAVILTLTDIIGVWHSVQDEQNKSPLLTLENKA